MEIMKKKRKEKKKSKPEKEKKTITLEKSTFTQRERKTKIQQNRKINDLAPAPLFIQPYIIIVRLDEQCRKGGDTLERVRYTNTGHVCMVDKQQRMAPIVKGRVI